MHGVMHMRIFISVLIVTLFSLGACKKSPPTPEAKQDHAAHDHAAHDHAGHEAKPAAEEPAAPAGPKIETGSFSLAVAPAQAKYAAGKPGELEIALESRGEWHVNQEYPIRVDLKATPGVTFPKVELVKDDATEFGDEKVRFLAAVEPASAGEHEVTCDVSFALCTEENCILEKRTLAMVLEVE